MAYGVKTMDEPVQLPLKPFLVQSLIVARSLWPVGS